MWIITNRFNLWRGETGANGVGDHPHRDEIQMNKQQKKTKIINVSRIWSKGEKMVWYSLTSGDSPPDFVGEFSHFQFPSGLRDVDELLEVVKGNNIACDLSKMTVDDLYLHCKLAAQELFHRTDKGNQEAADSLVQLGIYIAGIVEEQSIKHLEVFKYIAERQPVWPALVTPTPHNSQYIKQRMKILGLALKSEFAMHSKARWSPANIATWNAMSIIGTIRANQEWKEVRQTFITKNKKSPIPVKIIEPPAWVKKCWALSPLTKQTAKEWFNVGWDALMEATEGHPERDPELRPLGIYRARHSVYEGAQKKETPGTVEANIRDGIKARLLEAVTSLSQKVKKKVAPEIKSRIPTSLMTTIGA